MNFPVQELWEMGGIAFVGSPAYKGDRFVVDPYAFLAVLNKLARRYGDWVLRFNICMMLFEQLAMLRLGVAPSTLTK